MKIPRTICPNFNRGTVKVAPYKTELHHGNAYWMARLSQTVYTNEDESDKPDEEKILNDLRSKDKGFKSIKSANKSSAQAMLVEHNDYLCMAFRGTDEVADWIDNLNAFPQEGLFGKFHRGFWGSVEDVWTIINGTYKRLNAEKQRPLFITGHSLGGAMATVAASRFIDKDLPFVSVYTFGQPRSMTRETARIFNSEAGSRCYRFQNNEDLVTRVPARLMGYSHVGKCLYIDEDKKIHRDPGFWFKFVDLVQRAVDVVATEKSFEGIKDHNIAAYLEAIEEWDVDD